MSWVENLISRLGTVSDTEVYQSYRDAYGRHASRELAADMGVSTRTARRALSGATGRRQFTTGPRFAEAKAEIVAERVEGIAPITPGRVEVFYAGKTAGYRTIGPQSLAGHPSLPAITRALQRGDQASASDLIGGAVMDVYGAPMLTLNQ